MTAVQIQAAVGGMMAIEDKRAFKHHMRDFLVQVRRPDNTQQISGGELWVNDSEHHGWSGVRLVAPSPTRIASPPCLFNSHHLSNSHHHLRFVLLSSNSAASLQLPSVPDLA
jgi:hypothetical protein